MSLGASIVSHRPRRRLAGLLRNLRWGNGRSLNQPESSMGPDVLRREPVSDSKLPEERRPRFIRKGKAVAGPSLRRRRDRRPTRRW